MASDPENERPIDFADESSVRGKTVDRIVEAIPGDWVEVAARSGRGARFADPRRPGDQIRVMEGSLADPDPAKRGPYVRISKNGKVSEPIPLMGNPALEGGNR